MGKRYLIAALAVLGLLTGCTGPAPAEPETQVTESAAAEPAAGQ